MELREALRLAKTSQKILRLFVELKALPKVECMHLLFLLFFFFISFFPSTYLPFILSLSPLIPFFLSLLPSSS